MTADRIKTAIIVALENAKPDTSITVSDAQSFDDVALPRITIGIAGTEPHSPTLPGVQKLAIELRLFAHAKDTDTRAEIDAWCESIERTINDPTEFLAVVNGNATGARADYWLAAGGSSEWDETTLVVTWEAECWAIRIS